MKISNEQFSQLVKTSSKKARLIKTLPSAFLVGGLICAIGEFLKISLINIKFNKDEANSWTTVILIGITAILTGLRIFHKIAKFAGAGTFVPITGFANSVVSPAMEFKTEGFVLGAAAKMFSIAGPVIVYGIASSMVAGLIFYTIKLLGGTL